MEAYIGVPYCGKLPHQVPTCPSAQSPKPLTVFKDPALNLPTVTVESSWYTFNLNYLQLYGLHLLLLELITMKPWVRNWGYKVIRATAGKRIPAHFQH